MSGQNPRNYTGYAGNPPRVQWPGNARLALSVVLNYEEGAERCVLHGDEESESFLSELSNAQPRHGMRHLSIESVYEYGSRVGVWRLRSLFRQYKVPVTVFAVGMAAERNPQAVRALFEDGHEICSHGYRWIDYQQVDEDTERDHIQRAIKSIQAIIGERPLGWYTGRTGPNTTRLVAEEGGFLYHCDDYSDDLPFWDTGFDPPQLVIPYTLDANDMRFCATGGFTTGSDFYRYLKDSFDVLYAEGAQQPGMMSVGLHCRIAGRPGRFGAVERFLKYVRSHDDVWMARRVDIARHWRTHHPPESA
ncbi:MAG: allantoinase PuuE [Xanthomonadales bacterium]|nr:allantoinase PuuE [Xanthomonadales bacterium]